MRTAGILLSLIGALALVVSCGDDSEKPPIKLDTGGQQDTGGGQQDTGGGQQDTGGGQQDTSTGPASSSNAICSQTQACANSAEVCAFLEAGVTKGICIGKCNTGGAVCQVPDATKNLSKCQIQDPKTKQLYCVWLCKSGGKTYECPNSTDYKCLASNDPTIGFCAPKTGSTADAGPQADASVPQG